MKITFTAFILFLFAALNICSQPVWHTLPNSPITNGGSDDLSFINENTGWAVYNTSYIGNTGKIYKTTDGGTSWILQKTVSNVYMRCIGFTNSLTGFVGTLGNLFGLNPTPIMYKTTNGGTSWDSITFISNRPAGLCGLSVLNENFIFTCGRVGGPAYFAKTSNGGLNWISYNMSSYASMLIDCKFFSPDSGIVVGGVDTPSVMTKDIVLFTSDGGNTWAPRFINTTTNEWCWKISFINRFIGFVSFNNYYYSSHIDYIKTIDGGLNWVKLTCPDSGFTQGIGFLNENTGWLGGEFDHTYKTINGGLNWQVDNFGSYINRIRFLNDTIGYASGTRIYKFTTEPIGIHPISTEVPKQFSLEQNFPNPFNPATDIKFQIANSGFTSLVVYDILGREITTLVNEQLKAGLYSASWNASNYPSGVYYYRLVVDDPREFGTSNTNNGGSIFSQTKKLVLLK